MMKTFRVLSVDKSGFYRRIVIRGLKGEEIELVEGREPGIFQDLKTGTIFALPDKGSSVDEVVRCGVGWASLPADHGFTPGCVAHDAAYSIPAYQKYYKRSEADNMLYTHLRLLGANKVQAWCMTTVARIFGGAFWENDKTR